MEESKKKVGAPRGHVRSDLKFKLFTYCCREVDVYIRRLAVKKNQSHSRIVNDLILKAKRDASNESNSSASETKDSQGTLPSN